MLCNARIRSCAMPARMWIFRPKLPPAFPTSSSLPQRLNRSTKTGNTDLSSESNLKPASYSSTLNLPKTSFPMTIKNGEKRMLHEQRIREYAQFDKLYTLQLETNPDLDMSASSNEFILHDGPPYANGACHVGHAVNKIVKDIYNRHAILSGKTLNYVPGWDCHGLPIEHMAVNRLNAKHAGSNISKEEIRIESYAFARESIVKQRDAFRSWAVLADWEHNLLNSNQGKSTYVTLTAGYEAMLLDIFYKLHERGLINRSSMPVYWSPSSRTALAEAELEYNEKHSSTAVIVKLKLSRVPSIIQKHASPDSSVQLLIWTTTPWSLVANQAVCYASSMQYVLIENPINKNEYFIAAKSSLDFLVQEAKWGIMPKIIAEFNGTELADATYIHPIAHNQRDLPLLVSAHVTAGKGTGLVHCAPNHGHDDYLTFLKHNIALSPMLIDETGRFDAALDVGQVLPPGFAGKTALDDGTHAVVDYLRASDSILAVNSNYVHSYPYDWRTKKPVLIRASPQWFFKTKQILDRALQVLELDVRVIPESLKPQFADMLARRPYWCISRQRCWGTPIPVFYNNDAVKSDAISTRQSVEHIRKLFLANGAEAHNGSDIWWQAENTDHLLSDDLRARYAPGSLRRGQDILDIWFESGASWHHVLPVRPESGKQVADFVVEGYDQIGAWFQTSLLLSVALQDCAPFRSVYVHGFVLDGNGRKMSKSLGNVVDPNVLVSTYGADVLRLLVAYHTKPGADLMLSQQLIVAAEDVVRKWRNTMRFLLGTIDTDSFQFECDAVPYDKLLFVDKYVLKKLREIVVLCEQLYEEKAAHRVVLALLPFMTSTLSSMYFSVVKDRLYCEDARSRKARSAQTVIWHLLWNLNAIMAPILPHLTEECFATFMKDQGAVDCIDAEQSMLYWNKQKPFLIQSKLDAVTRRQFLDATFLDEHPSDDPKDKRDDELTWKVITAIRDEINRWCTETGKPSSKVCVGINFRDCHFREAVDLSYMTDGPDQAYHFDQFDLGCSQLADLLQVSQCMNVEECFIRDKTSGIDEDHPASLFHSPHPPGHRKVSRAVKQAFNFCQDWREISMVGGKDYDRWGEKVESKVTRKSMNIERNKEFSIEISHLDTEALLEKNANPTAPVVYTTSEVKGYLFELDDTCRCARCRKLNVIFEADNLCRRCTRVVQQQNLMSKFVSAEAR